MENSGDRSALLELATYAMSCARTSIDEGGKYGVLRFLEIFKRLAVMSQSEGRGEPLLIEIAGEISRAEFELLLETDDARVEFTDRMIRRLTAELKQRSGLNLRAEQGHPGKEHDTATTAP